MLHCEPFADIESVADQQQVVPKWAKQAVCGSFANAFAQSKKPAMSWIISACVEHSSKSPASQGGGQRFESALCNHLPIKISKARADGFARAFKTEASIAPVFEPNIDCKMIPKSFDICVIFSPTRPISGCYHPAQSENSCEYF